MPKTKGLTDKQQRFCQEYIIDLNATQAALRANYAAKSVSSFQSIGTSNLSKVVVQTEVQRLIAKREERTLISADKVVLELAKLAFSNIEEYLTVDEDGDMHLKNFESIERATLAAVESIKVSKVGTGKNTTTITQFKLCSKLNALEQLGKHLGIYQKDNQQKAQTIFDILAIVGIKTDSKAIEGTIDVQGQG